MILMEVRQIVIKIRTKLRTLQTQEDKNKYIDFKIWVFRMIIKELEKMKITKKTEVEKEDGSKKSV